MSDNSHLHSETHLKVLRLLEAVPEMSQRDLASRLGVSLGKANFCLNALLSKGLLKMQSFQNSKQKLAYAYLLTPSGIAEKATLTSHFLSRKMDEYEALRAEIEVLKSEVANGAGV
jgi:EPS-associated MarR family transcriptional regulator